MVKQKPRHTRRAPSKKHMNEGPINPHDEEDWTVVKKQIIKILIPPLLNKGNPTTGSVSEGEKLIDTNSQSPKSVHETRKSEPISPKQDIRPSEIRLARDDSPLISYRERSVSTEMMIFDDSRVFLDRRTRVSYLGKKLQKAGGLDNWLVSLGLGHFVEVFRTRSVGKFQLASLTMNKLKYMGTDAVGPRRKLMHAIDCLCEPHCFQHV